MAVRTVAYGPHPANVADLHRPTEGTGPTPVVVLIHGGFWRAGFDRTLMDGLATDLERRGAAAWNIEYRRVGQAGGGWPGLLEDVAAAVDALADLATEERLDLDRVVAVGHSAGGHLALWLAGRGRLPAGAPGADHRVPLRAAVSQAGVANLVAGFAARLGGGAVGSLLGGGPERRPERYRVADPAQLLPFGIPQLLVHGGADRIVPPSQSRSHAADARAAGDRVELVELAGVGHFELIDAGHAAWRAVLSRLPGLLA